MSAVGAFWNGSTIDGKPDASSSLRSWLGKPCAASGMASLTLPRITEPLIALASPGSPDTVVSGVAISHATTNTTRACTIAPSVLSMPDSLSGLIFWRSRRPV